MTVKYTLERLREINTGIECTRAKGNTTALLDLLYRNEKAILVVNSYRHKVQIIEENCEFKNRILTVNELGKIRGRDCFLVFDNSVLQSVICEAGEKLQKYGKNVEEIYELIKELREV